MDSVYSCVSVLIIAGYLLVKVPDILERKNSAISTSSINLKTTDSICAEAKTILPDF